MQTIPNVLGARTSQSALRYSLTAAHGYMWFDLDDSTMDIDLTEALRVVRDAVTLARSDVNTNGDDADVEGATINGDTLPASGGVRYVMLRIYASATTTMQSVSSASVLRLSRFLSQVYADVKYMNFCIYIFSILFREIFVHIVGLHKNTKAIHNLCVLKSLYI